MYSVFVFGSTSMSVYAHTCFVYSKQCLQNACDDYSVALYCLKLLVLILYMCVVGGPQGSAPLQSIRLIYLKTGKYIARDSKTWSGISFS